MKAPIRVKGSLQSKSQLSHGGLLVIFTGLGLLAFFQGQQSFKSSSGGSSSGRVIVEAMQARLNGVSEGITSYLENHDASSLERIKSEGKDASRLLEGFQEESSRSGSEDAYKRVESAEEDIRQATLHLLDVDHAVVTQAAALRQSTDDLRQLSRKRRHSRRTDEARMLAEQRVSDAQDQLTKAQKQKESALKQYRQSRDALATVLKENGFGRGSGIRSIRHAFSSGFAFSVLAGTLVFFGVVFILLATRGTEKELVKPLREILQCVEAAAAGDISRLPDHWSQDEVGQLSQAVARLIGVLARSENLVYHLAALVESSGEAIISHNLDGTILSWNKGAQRIYGYSAEEVKGQSIAILSPSDDGAEVLRHLERIKNGERIQPFETTHQARNGRSVQAFVRVSAILDSTRKVIGATFCAQDLTDTIRHETKTLKGINHA